MVLACQNITKSFGEELLMENASFHVNEREKVAIVGLNGTGKSTLLKMIVGEEPIDSGEVVLAKGKTLGYLAQQQTDLTGNTIYQQLLMVKQDILDLESTIRRLELEMKHAEGDELNQLMNRYHNATTQFEQKDGYAYKSEITGILKGLGFGEDEFEKSVDTLSGGQKTRVALGKLLLSKPDIILLDEPTNHLDISSINWLETFLLNYDGTVVIVSHDRYFLNRIVSKVIELDNGTLRTFTGNYSDYSVKKAQLRETLRKEYLNQQREIKHQEEVIQKLKSFNREKSIKRAESREKQLSKIQVLDKPADYTPQMHFQLEPQILSGNDVLTLEQVGKSFDDLCLFSDVNMALKRGEKLAIIGNNGTGKTTLLKIINGLIEPDSGLVKLGSKVTIGYYDQEHNVLHSDKTLFEEISDAYPNLSNTQIRNTLAAFLFTNDDVFKQISDLSGGERGRVSLAKLMLSEANLLILDEPTNHLDITSKEILEEAINNYTGTVLYVSHDRYFVNSTATRILELENQTFINYIGNYDYYLEKKAELTGVVATETTANWASSTATPAKTEDTAGKLDWKQQKEEQARQRKRENDLKKCEERIALLEARSSEIDEDMAKPEIATASVKLQELANEQAKINEELETLYEKWEDLAE